MIMSNNVSVSLYPIHMVCGEIHYTIYIVVNTAQNNNFHRRMRVIMKRQKHSNLRKLTALFLTLLMVLSTIPMTNLASFVSGAMSVETPMNYYGAEDEARVDMNFNKNWKFYYNYQGGDAQNVENAEVGWKDVDLPHDFSILQEYTLNDTEAESGFLPGGTGWYRKSFTLPTALKDKRIIINFDGAYKDTYLYVNGTLIGENHYGYNPFSFDITDNIKYANDTNQNVNVIAVKVENQLPSSRWYSGSGLNRDVTLTVLNPVHVSLNGTQVISNTADGTAETTVTVQNESSSNATVEVTAQILSADGKTELGSADVKTITVNGNNVEATTVTPAYPGKTNWDVNTDSPALYILRTTLKVDGAVVDQYDTKFGYRDITWDANTGFKLNNRSIRMMLHVNLKIFVSALIAVNLIEMSAVRLAIITTFLVAYSSV